jgi:hypothetical protein
MAGRVGTGKTGTGSDKRLRDEATLVCQHQQQLGLPGFCDADRWSRPIGDPVRLWRTYALVFLADFSGLMRKLFRAGRLSSLRVGFRGFPARRHCCLLQLGACTRLKL